MTHGEKTGRDVLPEKFPPRHGLSDDISRLVSPRHALSDSPFPIIKVPICLQRFSVVCWIHNVAGECLGVLAEEVVGGVGKGYIQSSARQNSW
jgi:hypothetical protein